MLAVLAGAEVARARYGRAADRTETDGADFTTAADIEAERAIRAVLTRHRPDDAILGEELGSDGESSRRWLVDPICGTLNFAAGVPLFSVERGIGDRRRDDGRRRRGPGGRARVLDGWRRAWQRQAPANGGDRGRHRPLADGFVPPRRTQPRPASAGSDGSAAVGGPGVPCAIPTSVPLDDTRPRVGRDRTAGGIRHRRRTEGKRSLGRGDRPVPCRGRGAHQPRRRRTPYGRPGPCRGGRSRDAPVSAHVVAFGANDDGTDRESRMTSADVERTRSGYDDVAASYAAMIPTRGTRRPSIWRWCSTSSRGSTPGRPQCSTPVAARGA